MIPVPRPYQAQFKTDIYAAWNAGHRNVLGVLATRGGKTVTFADIIHEHPGAAVAIAHRQELIGQISLTLARFGVRHRVVAPTKVARFIVQQHMHELGQSYYDPTARASVAGIDTLISPGRQEELKGWAGQQTLWVMDEAHHILKNNKWGRGTEMFPRARGLGVTANTIRADGKGLGKDADGIMDALVTSIGLYELIALGYATPYRVISPAAKDLDLDSVSISGATGDYSRPQLVAMTRRSSVIGDVVKHYLKFAPGKLGITFAPDVETAGDIAKNFNAAGVPAEVISAKTPDSQRISIQEKFKRRDILQMVNVDLFGEGYDVPAIEVVSMARATASFNLFCQQFARGLTVMDGKKEAIILDHVGNCIRFSMGHGMPDSEIVWSLDRRERGTRGVRDPDLIPQRMCTNPECLALYEAIHKCCPWCGHYPQPAARTGPQFVDGDLTELDAATLEEMRGRTKGVDTPVNTVHNRLASGGWNGIKLLGAVKNHRVRQETQAELREAIAWWAGHSKAEGFTDSESYRRFYYKFGIDVLSATVLGKGEAVALADRINKEIERCQSPKH